MTENCEVEQLSRSAIKTEDINLIKTLLNVPTGYEDVLLHVAASYGISEIVEVLVKHGFDVNAVDEYQRTPLHVVMLNVCGHQVKESELCRIVRILLDAGSDPNVEDCNRETPLINIFVKSSGEGFDLMLRMGPHIQTQKNLNNLLYKAVMMGNVDKLKRLIELGVDINALNEDGLSTLHLAVIFSKYDVIKFLLTNNVNVNILNNNGLDSLRFALSTWTDEYHVHTNVDEDIEQGWNKKIYKNHVKCIRLLLDFNFNVNNGPQNDTALYEILRNPYELHSDFARILLKHGAKFDFDHCIVREVLDNFDKSKIPHLLLRHAAMSEEKNRSDGPVNFDITKLNESCQEDYANCCEELELMKMTKIDDTTVSFFNILANRDIGPYTRNKHIKSLFKTLDVSKLFPVYGDLLSERFSEELETQKLKKKAAPSLSSILKFNENSLPLIFTSILNYLDKRDLIKLADS